MRLSRLILLSLALVTGGLRGAEKPAAPEAGVPTKPQSREEALQQAGIKLQSGPVTVPLGQTAEIKLPAGYHFVGKDSLDRFYELTQNMRSGTEVGVVLAPGYMLYFDYEEVGYVKDEDKDKLDAEKLLKSMTEGQDEANEERKKRGWDQVKLTGWATKPYYDPKTNNLKWALNLTSSQDNYKEVWINESIRLLGRGGVMNVTLAAGTPAFKAAEADADKLLAESYTYVAGQKYAEFKAGDKIAAYGLSALVLGGAGVMAAKMGLLAKLGVFFGKFWKGLVFVVLAIGASIKKFFNKLTGARPEESGTPPSPPTPPTA
jgi:uncharacterized membrane-anchored protein